MSRPLRNRVSPFGAIEAVAARGTLMGNRGGRLHDAERRLGRRRWVSARWISCELSFRGRRREVMGAGYTELFFLDDAVALAAGHRPCFECRRAEARAFAQAWAEAAGAPAPPKAGEMDARLHAQRLGRRAGARAKTVPDGAMFARDGAAFLKLGDAARPWGWAGYGPPAPLPRETVEVLTPRSALGALAAGWLPRLHPSAAQG